MWFVHEYYDPWGRLHRVPAGTPVPNFQMSAIKIQWAYWRFYDRHESAWLTQAAWRAWPGPLIPSWFWATNKTNNNNNICEESTDAPASTDALRAVEMTYENNLIGPQQGLFYDGIAYAHSDEDGAGTEDDYICEIEDGLERGA